MPNEATSIALRTRDFDYALPDGRIARYPAETREGSRLLVLDRNRGHVTHRTFPDIVDLMAPGDLAVVNDTRVLPARLLGRKPTGAAAEILLLAPAAGVESTVWEALVRPGGKLKPGRVVAVGEDLAVRILGSLPGGRRLVELETPLGVAAALERYGQVPLPPYLERAAEPLDRERYQTVYAEVDGSVAAPTAGLHFTLELLARLEARGIDRAQVTLHVGVGTFRPVEVPDPADHFMHRERYDVPPETARAIQRCKRNGGRVWAVGTTVVRTLESAAGEDGVVESGPGSTRLFIRPPFHFRVVDGLVTNFHLPRSTLLMLVSAFGGVASVRAAYAEAIRLRYRFYSYGDAMAVQP